MKNFITKITFLFVITLLINVQGFAQLKDALKLTLSSGPYSDETVIRFLDMATDSFDGDWDAYKLRNGGNTPNFFTVLHNEPYTINALNGPFTEKTVALNIEVAFSGTYTITSDQIGQFDSLCSITLIDKVLNVSQDLKVSSAYTFDCVQGDSSNRFLVEFKYASPAVVENFDESPSFIASPSLISDVISQNTNSISVYSKENKIMIESNDITADVSIGIYDLSGREISKEGITNVSSSSSKSSWEFSSESTGIFIVKVVAGNQSYSGKVYVNL